MTAIALNGRQSWSGLPALKPDNQLADTLRKLRWRFGQAGLTQPGKAVQFAQAAIPTGIPTLDKALGVGGLPRGRIVDIVGPESGGKTTLCLKVIAEAQRQGGIGVFVDTEHALDPIYARHCGVELENLYVSQPDTAEEALEIVEALVRAGVDVAAIDSAAGLIPKAEVETDMGDHYPGLMAGLMSQALRHYASVRFDLRRLHAVKSGGQVVGARIRATVKKNKVAPPHRRAEFDRPTDYPTVTNTHKRGTHCPNAGNPVPGSDPGRAKSGRGAVE